jgi:serine phosphatase RsbU (regulator of sigma subunit)/anti-sigma regulatory factor (Ser/Thr protein kinase)
MPVTAGPIPRAPDGDETWDPGLRAVLDLVLASPVAMALALGERFTLYYNDAYADLLGARHPAAHGRPAAEVFPEAWPDAAPALRRLVETGKPAPPPETVGEAAGEPALPERGMSTVRDAGGRIAGVLVVAAEPAQVADRLRGLGELAAALAATLTLDDVARVALGYALDSTDVDQAAFGVDDGTAWRVVRRIRGELLDEADERLPPVWRRLPADSAAPLASTAVTGRDRYVQDGAPLRDSAADRHDEKVRALAALPLRTPSLRGALTFGRWSPYPWPEAERALLTAAAELVAQAAERARRFETQHGTSQLLQRSMLPQHLPDSPRFRLAARYEPGVDGNAAGGDFYDAFALPGGRLGVVLGDVAGHDVRAAALMGQIRAALRALALADADPATVLRGLDRLVASLAAESRSDELFVTVVYGVVEPDGRLTVATAGHPPPLVRRPVGDGEAGAAYLDMPVGTPLGLGGERRNGRAVLAPGETLLLFSDGVFERRGHDLGAGFDAVAAAIAKAVNGDPRTLCALATAAVAGATEDDVAVLAVEHAITPSRSAGMEIPAEPTAPGRVRQWMTTQLTAWQVPEQVIGAAVLCASELATNALLHAGTAARVQVDLSPERLLVAVSDSGTRGAVTRARTEALSSRGRGLGLIEQLSDSWGTDPAVRGSTVWFEMAITDKAGE